MSIIATVWHHGHRGRAPKLEESLALEAMRANDTADHLTQVPCGMKINGICYYIIWSDNPPENLPDDTFDAYYNSGVCADCGKLWGDHAYRGVHKFKAIQPLKGLLKAS